MKEITKMTARRLAAALAKREVSAKEAAKAYLGRIGEADGEIGAYLTVTRETPRAARALAARISRRLP